MDTRSLAVGSVVLLLVLGGCLSGNGAGQQQSPDSTPTPTPAPSLTSGTPTPPDRRQAANQPDPDIAVDLANEWNRSATVDVRVVREATGETVHSGTYDLAPGTEREVYNTARANPDGIESFSVVVTARNTTRNVTVETNRCYGDVFGEVREDGSLHLFYSIC